MRTAAVLPVKSFDRAKQRLAARVGSPTARRSPPRWSATCWRRCGACPGLDDLIVVTAEPQAAGRGGGGGRRRSSHDPAEAGQSEAAARGIAAALGRGADRVPARPRRLPGARPGRGRRAARPAPGAPGVVIVPTATARAPTRCCSRRLTSMPPAFGPGSFARHDADAGGRRGERAGRACAVARARRRHARRPRRPARRARPAPRRRAAHARAARDALARPRHERPRRGGAPRPAGDPAPATISPRCCARRRAAADPGLRAATSSRRPQGGREGRRPRRPARRRSMPGARRPPARRRARQGPAPRRADPRRDRRDRPRRRAAG